MTKLARSRASLEKLLKLARVDTDALRADLVDIERARASAELSMSRLEEAVRREEDLIKGRTGAEPAAPLVSPDPARLARRSVAEPDFAAYLEGVRERRRNLQTTLMTLAEAEGAARTRLESAHIEIKKLEHLLAMNEEAAKTATVRSRLRAADEAAAARRRAP